MQDLIDNLKKLGNSCYKDITDQIEVEAENFVKDSFNKEGFTDKALTKWQPVKRTDGKKILTQSGDLHESIEAKVSGGVLKITSDLPYAEIHNEGGKAGRNLSATIPKRQFVGESEKMKGVFEKTIKETIERKLK